MHLSTQSESVEHPSRLFLRIHVYMDGTVYRRLMGVAPGAPAITSLADCERRVVFDQERLAAAIAEQAREEDAVAALDATASAPPGDCWNFAVRFVSPTNFEPGNRCS